MERYQEIIDEIKKETDTILLFTSATGKDSIILQDLCAKNFKKVVCVYMYTIKNLEHIQYYINYATRKYPNISFIQFPHFSLSDNIRNGTLGHWKNPKQKRLKLEDIIDAAREATGIQWVCLGFKKSDGLNRRVMLMTYENEGIYRKGFKFFPLSGYTNKWCYDYIERNQLIPTLQYYGKGASSGVSIDSLGFLLWVRDYYPQDLEKVYAEFPMARKYLFDYDRQTENINKGEDTQN